MIEILAIIIFIIGYIYFLINPFYEMEIPTDSVAKANIESGALYVKENGTQCWDSEKLVKYLVDKDDMETLEIALRRIYGDSIIDKYKDEIIDCYKERILKTL